MEQVEEQVERNKQKDSGKKAKKEKKLKKDKKDKNKKDKSAKKDKKRQEAAFIDVPSNVVEHPEPEMQIPPAVDKAPPKVPTTRPAFERATRSEV